MISAGRLDKRVRFDSPTPTEDGFGGREDGWTAQMTVWACYTRLRGGETVLASRLEGRQPTVIRVRASSAARAITTDWRAVDVRTGETFNIRSIVETQDRAWLDITAESGVAT